MTWKRIIAFLACWTATCTLTWGVAGSWNGVAATAINGVAQTAWNGTGVSSAAGGGGFSPSDIAGMQLWLAADATVYNTGVTQATNGQTVETWVDASGNAVNATATGGEKPTWYSAGGPNSKPGITFGGSQMMTCAGVAVIPKTIFAVFEFTANNQYQSVFINYGFGSPSIMAADTNETISNHNGNSAAVYIDGVVKTVSNYNLYNVGIAFTNNVFRLVSTTSTAGTNYGYSYTIGATASGGAKYLNGVVCEIIMYDTQLGTTDRQNIEDYLGTKYSITITH